MKLFIWSLTIFLSCVPCYGAVDLEYDPATYPESYCRVMKMKKSVCLNLGLKWQEVNLDHIRQIESNNDPSAFNPISEAVGAFQLTAIVIRDFNRENGSKVTLDAMYDESKAAHLAIWYTSERLPRLIKAAGFKDTIENRIIGWNCGVKCLGKPLPKETRDFLKKYRNLVAKNKSK